MNRRRWLLLAAAVVVAWIVAAAFLLVRAAGDLDEGRDLAKAARRDLTPASLADGEVVDDLRAAEERFRAARRDTGHPLLAPVRLLPVLGRQVRAVRTLSGAAADVTGTAATAASDAVEVLDRPSSGPARVEQLRDLSRIVDRVAVELEEVDLGSGDALLDPIGDARTDLARELADARRSVDDAAAGARAALALFEGPRRYLVVAANNAEMRAGSGMWLTGGVLTTGDGRLQLDDVQPLYAIADPPDGEVPVTDADLAARWDEHWHPSWDWRSLMVSPRLPASAALAMDMWAAGGQQPVDGVLVVDPISLAAIVRGTRATDPSGAPLDADEIPEILLHRQYRTFPGRGEVREDRREALGFVARLAFGALDAGDWDPAELAAELSKAVRGRHLLAWSRNPVEQRGWVAAGMGGDLAPDSLAVSVLNRGANKLDWFLDVEGDIATQPVEGGTEVTVTVRLVNRARADLPAYVVGPADSFGWPPGTYVGLLTVNVPGPARDLDVQGEAPTYGNGPDGPTQVTAVEVRIGPGEELEHVIRFRLPGRQGALTVESSARVPAIRWNHRASSWQDTAPRTAKW